MLPIGGAPARPRRRFSWWWLLRLSPAAVPAFLLVGMATGVGDRLGPHDRLRLLPGRSAPFDLGAADPNPLSTFYADLFGWTLQQMSDFYTVIVTGGGISGGIGRSQSGESWSTFYVEMGDLQSALDKAGSLGGSTVVPPIEIPGVATWAMFHDPDGLLIQLLYHPPISDQSL